MSEQVRSAACPHCGQERAMGMKSAGQGRERKEKQWAHKGYPPKQRGCCFGHRSCLHPDSIREPRKAWGMSAEEQLLIASPDSFTGLLVGLVRETKSLKTFSTLACKLLCPCEATTSGRKVCLGSRAPLSPAPAEDSALLWVDWPPLPGGHCEVEACLSHGVQLT